MRVAYHGERGEYRCRLFKGVCVVRAPPGPDAGRRRPSTPEIQGRVPCDNMMPHFSTVQLHRDQRQGKCLRRHRHSEVGPGQPRVGSREQGSAAAPSVVPPPRLARRPPACRKRGSAAAPPYVHRPSHRSPENFQASPEPQLTAHADRGRPENTARARACSRGWRHPSISSHLHRRGQATERGAGPESTQADSGSEFSPFVRVGTRTHARCIDLHRARPRLSSGPPLSTACRA
ncbi:hypothetical protein BC834DRAFT_497830 [Gloeopeniophorella convolvens]|nr:hypothetical protein BC834DRAFT_497830 [Gloeopeniophorella convolvens]